MSFKSFLRDNKEAVDINVSMPTDAIELANFIEKANLDTIVISTEFGDRIVANIDFLAGIINKQNIKEMHVMCEVEDYSLIYQFKNLCKITLCCHKKIAANLDLTKFPKLNQLGLNGDFKISGLENSLLNELMINKSKTFEVTSKCEYLQKLEIASSSFNDLEQLKFLPNLNKLILTQLSITSLEGIEELQKLDNLAINYCSKLTRISNIVECKNLKKLEFNTCKKIESFDSLSELKSLIGLVIGNCSSINSLSFIRQMSGLKFLSFVNTNIIDGDLTECLKLQNVGLDDRKHYNIKSKDLPKNKNYAFWKL